MKKDDNGLTHLFVAMGAVAFFVAGVPILDAFGGWVSNLFGLQSIKLSTTANDIANANTEEVEQTQCIGFHISDNEGEIEDE